MAWKTWHGMALLPALAVGFKAATWVIAAGLDGRTVYHVHASGHITNHETPYGARLWAVIRGETRPATTSARSTRPRSRANGPSGRTETLSRRELRIEHRLMDWLLRRLADRLGVAPAQAGEAITPRIQFEQPFSQCHAGAAS